MSLWFVVCAVVLASAAVAFASVLPGRGRKTGALTGAARHAASWWLDAPLGGQPDRTANLAVGVVLVLVGLGLAGLGVAEQLGWF